MSKIRTLGQKRAAFALKKVLDIEPNKKERFEPFSAGAPSMILQNGFGQALAFWIAKGKNEHMTMFNIVKDWLCENGFMKIRPVERRDKKPEDEKEVKKEVMRAISEMEQSEYLRAQRETLALLEWVKRFANAEL